MAARRAKRKQSPAPSRGTGASRSAGSSSRGAGPSRNAAAWFLVGAISGSLVTWAGVGRDQAAEQVRSVVGSTVGHPIGIDPAAPPPKPKFEYEFYRVLEMEEVVVPEEELAATRPANNAPANKDTSASEIAPAGKDASASKNAPAGKDASAGKNALAGKDDPTDTAGSTNEAPTAAKPEGGPYIVQIASFRHLKDADSLKAELILNGFNPVVQSVVLSGEEKRYRVRLGPYPDRDSLDAARVRLRSSGHGNPLVVRVKRS